MTPTTNELLMRVLRVESPGLFDGSEYEPMEVVEWDHCDYCPAICKTCGDEPENRTIKYRTRNGLTDYESYDDFGLAEMMEALDKWDANEEGRKTE